MGDRLRPPSNSLTASAKLLTATRQDEPKNEHWHEEAWDFRNTTGELRFAEMWLGNSLSRVRLVAAKRPEPGAAPEPVEDGPAAEAMAEFCNGPGGQAAINRAFAAQLMTPGVGYLVGEPTKAGAGKWGVYSADQIRLSSRTDDQTGDRMYELRTGDDQVADWRPLPAGTLVVRVWRPHPRWSWLPDSPVRGALPILRELQLLTMHVEASATSRLAGAGLLVFDSNIQMPEGWDAWVKDFLDAVTKPIKDRASAAAYAPFPVRIPGPVKDKVMHLAFSTPFDEQSMQLRDEALGRLATAMDMPKAALTGEQENHWGKWATTEEGITLHVEPNMELICDGLTRGYLWPYLAADGSRSRGRPATREELVQVLRQPPQDQPEPEFIVWYDATDLRVRPDRSEDTINAYDRWEADGDALRRQLGITEEQAPKGAPFERRVWLTVLEKGGDAALQKLALQKLGVATEDELPATPAPIPATVGGPPSALPPGDEDEVEDDGRALPPTRDAPPPSQDAPRQAPQAASVHLHPGLPLVAACDGLVHRALERCGNRLRNHTTRLRATDPDTYDQPPHLMHTVCTAARLRPLEVLLEGSWDRVPAVAAALGFDPEQLADQLDAYTRQLIRTRTPHSWDALADYLMADRREAG